ncbi:BldC family transcriptional regulator [Nocardioides mesophilus]|uniref:BldC family transcriptional regulator n=1 Tax=Nocardioides mesophilus TaxID=433659 RepID=A0A7G9REL7_9ACTN|nr:BldC family transcriptional regulator [Nocardioides mesophilus]QNN54042.1 BldC family transcriptional regulator [Nocardioides mesophilus]
MARTRATGDELLTPAEVAAIFGVDPKTVARWADTGLVSSIRTLGGHRRYSASEIRVRLLLLGQTPPRQRKSSPAS